MNNQWWKRAVVYQIYPQSFKDSDGDGIGDLPGIIEKLDYLAELGIDVLWICPIFRSPMVDNGYDVADYRSVDPMFGSDRDLDELIAAAKDRGIKIVLDLVLNHCSDQHEWFRRALNDPDSEEAGYFYFRRTEDGRPPNNWRSNFGGSAWARTDDGRWYLHTFAREQPDLNWENPELRRELYDMINWWLDKGVGGFRIDAITFIKKDLSFASGDAENGALYPIENFQSYPGIGEFLVEMKRETFAKYDAVTVAEAPGVSPELFAEYAGPDGHFSMIFDFNWDHMKGVSVKGDPESVAAWRSRIFESVLHTQEHGWSAIFLENHDQARCPDKFLDKDKHGRDGMACLATTYMLLRGTPFIYQGQELGMTNGMRSGIGEFQDVSALNQWEEGLAQGRSEEEMLRELNNYGRDNARSPFQWNAETHAGFTTGTPWMPVHPAYREVNAKKLQADGSSILAYYKELIAFRKSEEWSDVLAFGSFEPALTEYASLIAYRRTFEGRRLLVLNNYGGELELPLEGREVVFDSFAGRGSSGAAEEMLKMPPYRSVVLAETE
ncbi:glucohydrolase [Saccharibacillus sp. O23]|uniref:alpha-glucosidase n=1 Tax=Saccharibacillus sp. O23 TaxID=2009338 RepID=UPI000B4E5DDC|nr:alpha-glucosidase [Saccharibacillus sp. O23]OWR30696.1 glucohydrolase [Saccharibacillus sp. O23]